MKRRTVTLIIILMIGFFCLAKAQSDIDQDLNRRVNWQQTQLIKTRDGIRTANELGIKPKIQAVIEKFDSIDRWKTDEHALFLERTINPNREAWFKNEVITKGFIRCDFVFEAGTDSYEVQRFIRKWADYIGQSGFECFVYFIGWVGKLKVCGYEYDPIQLKINSFK